MQKTSLDQAAAAALAILPSRAHDIVARRFGIGRANTQTLDAIGKNFDITRERVRQIVRASIAQINDASVPEYERAQKVITDHIRAKGGIVHVDRLFAHFEKMHQASRAALNFLIAASRDVDLLEKHRAYPVASAVHLKDFDFDQWHRVYKDVHAFLEERTYLCTHDDLYAVVAKSFKHLDSIQALEHLHVAHTIKENPFGKWGFTKWSDVDPKNIRDKVYVILAHEQKPMHFRAIAEAIDKHGLGKGGRTTHPQTVHNELIKDARFVLVGRGTYALASRDYISGSVRDIIRHLLTTAKKPLTMEAIIQGVLTHRDVKPSTIKINVHAVAKKTGDTYTLK